MKTQRALTVAKYFLSITDEDSGDLISNLKLQKLLYYAQGFSVALNGVDNPIFRDKVYAWKHGPVVKSVYHHYSSAGSGALPKEDVPDSLDGHNMDFLNEIYRIFGRYSAWKLREMTHREMPWKKNFIPDKLNLEIPLEDLKLHFVKHVKADKA